MQYEKEDKEEIEHFNNLPYPVQYWCFENFIQKNIKDADYFIEDIKAKVKRAL